MSTSKRWIFFAEPCFLISAFVFQLFVSVSLPIFKPIDLFILHITDSSYVANQGEIRFGLWGFCFLNEYNTGTWDYGVCSSPKIGYSLDPTIVSILGLSPYLYDVISEVLTGFLVIHPIIAGITLISIIPGAFPLYRVPKILSLVLNIISAILSTLITALDLAIVIVAKSKLDLALAAAGATNLGLSFSISFGNALWMSLAAVFCLWIAVITGSIVACSCCGGAKYDTESADTSEEAAERAEAEEIEEEQEERRWRRWWKRRRRSVRRHPEKRPERD